jgi:transcriptional regulator with PAS, ATPase and Fis domain
VKLTKEGISLYKALQDLEVSLIEQALKLTANNRRKAAKLLDIERTNLQMKMRKLGLLRGFRK